MSQTEFLTIDDLIDLVRRLGIGPVRDIGLLDAALARTRSSAFGAEAYPSITLKAAALMHALVRNHALIDGNKRLGWLAAAVFLDINGRPVDLDDEEAFQLVMDIAEGKAEVEEIASRLAQS